MKPVLIYIRPLDQATNTRVDVRIGDGLSAEEFGTAGVPWQPALTQRPTLSIELMSPDMNGAVQAGSATFEIQLRALRGIDAAELLYWGGAPVVITSSGVLEGSTSVPDFWGYITEGTPDRDTGKLKLTAKVSTTLIETDLLINSFGGGGGNDGDATKRGVLKPAGFGAVNNIEPVWFDLTRNIGQVDGYGNTLAITWLGEGLASFGPSVGDYPTYAALAAAIDADLVPRGRWATCIAEGMVGLGAPPTGTITVRAVFGFNRIGAMMKRMLLVHAKVPAARVDAAGFDGLDALVPRPVHYWVAEQIQVKDVLESLAASCNATPLVTFQNQVTVTRAVLGNPVATLDRSGSVAPRVVGWQTASVDPPYAQLKGRAARPALVMSFDQVNYNDTIEDRGLYHTDTVYRQGNVVWLSNGSEWLYVNAIPSKGNNPPLPPLDSDDYWQMLQPPTTAADIVYADGTPIEELKPAEPGATAGAPVGTKVAGRDAQDVIDDIDTNAASYIAEALRQDQYQQVMDARTFVDGQDPSTYFIQLRNEVRNSVQIINTVLSLLGLKSPDATAFIMNLQTVQNSAGKTLAQLFTEVSAANDDIAVDVQQLMEALINPDGSGLAKYVLRVTAGGAIAGIAATADGKTGRLSFVANMFDFTDPNGANPVNVFSYDGTTLYAPALTVSKLTADSVATTNLVNGAVQATNFALMSQDVSIARGATSTVVSLTFTKSTSSSLLKVMFFGMFSSPDDLQFNGAFVIDGSVSYSAGKVNINLDSTNSQGSMPITPFLYLQNVGAGQHTISFSVTNNEVDNLALTVKQGSALELLEIKKGALG